MVKIICDKCKKETDVIHQYDCLNKNVHYMLCEHCANLVKNLIEKGYAEKKIIDLSPFTILLIFNAYLLGMILILVFTQTHGG